jgi:hypothetical protein
MDADIRILTVEKDGEDGLIVRFSDGTLGAYVVEELLELRPCRNLLKEPGIDRSRLAPNSAHRSAAPGCLHSGEAAGSVERIMHSTGRRKGVGLFNVHAAGLADRRGRTGDLRSTWGVVAPTPNAWFPKFALEQARLGNPRLLP